MKNLKVGDKVRCIDNYTAPLTKGAEYIVTSCGDGTIQVGNCKDWYMISRFELIEPTQPLPPAVLVQNEREFKIVMKDFENKGWQWKSGLKPTHFNSLSPSYFDKNSCYIECCDKFCIAPSLDDRPIISFADYALIAGIEVPKEEINIELEYGSVKIRPEFKDIEFNNSSGDIESSIWFTDLDKIIEAYQKLK